MANLSELRHAAEQNRLIFIAEVRAINPDFDAYHWYRARAWMDNHVGRRNDDTSFDDVLASSAVIESAHDAYIKALHIFYGARDGAGGVLGNH